MVKHKYPFIKELGISTFTVLILFAWQGNKGFSLWDEGFLWYGVQRVMLGEVPIRDFMSYDPGRYYWSAGLMSIWGDNGIMSLRVSVAIFQALGLCTGLCLIFRSTKEKPKDYWPYIILATLTLAAWMFPRHKLYDISLSIFLLGALAFLVERPTSRRHFIAGVCIGLAAVFGSNHGLYGLIGGLGVLIWLNIKRPDRSGALRELLAWAAGIIAGFSPTLLMALMVPGFASAFWDGLRFLAEQKSTNLPLLVPWPWTITLTTVSADAAIRGILVGLFFIGILIFGALAAIWTLVQKYKARPTTPALVATAFLSLPYAHFAFSRADVGHLAQGIFPMLIGCLALLSTRGALIKWPLAIILLAGSLWTTYPLHPGWQFRKADQYVNVEISGDNLRIDRKTANEVSLLRKLVNQYAPDNQTFIATPFWPGAYALLGRRSPMWENYALFPSSEKRQQTEIERIKTAKPGFAVIFDFPLDNRDELRFQNTHPLIHRYILDNFERIPNPTTPAYQIYRRESGP